MSTKPKMTSKQKNRGRGTKALLKSMAELDGYARQGMTINDVARHVKQHHPGRVREVFRPPEPGKYPPAAVKKLRHTLDMSQAAFADSLGVSRILLQGWEQGVRTPSRLACRLLDIISKNSAAWLATLRPVVKQQPPRSRRAG